MSKMHTVNFHGVILEKRVDCPFVIMDKDNRASAHPSEPERCGGDWIPPRMGISEFLGDLSLRPDWHEFKDKINWENSLVQYNEDGEQIMPEVNKVEVHKVIYRGIEVRKRVDHLFLATNHCGEIYSYLFEPEENLSTWDSHDVDQHDHCERVGSFHRLVKDWEKSLVEYSEEGEQTNPPLTIQELEEKEALFSKAITDAQAELKAIQKKIKDEKPVKRWRAEKGGIYLYINDNGYIVREEESHSKIDANRYKSGNYAQVSEELAVRRTKNEARQRIIDRIAEENRKHDWVADWDSQEQRKFYGFINHITGTFDVADAYTVQHAETEFCCGSKGAIDDLEDDYRIMWGAE